MLLDQYGKELTPSPAKKRTIQALARDIVRARYDTIAKTPENSRHWQWVDHLSPDASLSPEVRRQVRAQARYEIGQNNSIGRGIVNTFVSDIIGTGPRLQMQLENDRYNREIEKQFGYWCEAVGLVDHLRLMRRAQLIDGAALARSVTDMTVDDPVTYNLQLIEIDQLQSPFYEPNRERYVDGIHLDRLGNPIAYDILKHHPGSQDWTPSYEYNTYSSLEIFHSFKKERPGQHHGISELVSALPLFAFLRRFTLATVAAAETAASVAQVLETDTPIPEGLEEEWASATFGNWNEAVPIDRNSATVLPNEWKMKQFAAEHPTTTYRMFKQEVINEIARCICMPKNIASADSSDYNYASGRLDHLGYQRVIHIEQIMLVRHVLNRVFAEWLIEAALSEVLPPVVSRRVIELTRQFGHRGISSRFSHAWYWDGKEDVDEQKSASAQRLRLQSGTTHRAAEYAARGKDVDVEDELAAKSMGMTVEEYRRMVAISTFTNGNLIEEPDEQETQEPSSQPEGDPQATDA